MNTRAHSQAKPATSSFTPAPVNLIQRKCACGSSAGLSGECEECQKGKLTGESVSLMQPKLKISQPNDKYEQEADRIADEVMRMPEPRVQRQIGSKEREDGTIQTKPIGDQITPLLQRQASGEEVEEKVHDAVRSTGHLLDSKTRNYMESRFGRDFGQLKIHTDEKAAAVAQSLNARAYTMGGDIVFGANEFQPQTSTGRRLLAHELTHYLQQQSSNDNQTVMRVEVDDCEETAGHDLLIRHFYAQRLLRKAIGMTAERNERKERTQAVKAALLSWFNIDLDFLPFENAQKLLHIERAMQAMLDGSEDVVYECDEEGFFEVCKPGRSAAALTNIHICPSWWTESEDRQAIILMHEWAHKFGPGINRLIETYCWEGGFKNLSSKERIKMPDAYEGYISELSLGKGTCA